MSDSNSEALFSQVVEKLNDHHFAYLHIIEPHIGGSELIHDGQGAVASGKLRRIFKES